jgi:hypothetical protein
MKEGLNQEVSLFLTYEDQKYPKRSAIWPKLKEAHGKEDPVLAYTCTKFITSAMSIVEKP